MLPMKFVRQALTRYLAQYGSPLNDRDLQWVLNVNDIPENEDVVYADLELATFGGYAARLANTPPTAPSYWSNAFSNFVPINMATGVNGGTFFQLSPNRRMQYVFFKNAAGSGTENPSIVLTQATDDIGTDEKPLAILRSWVKTDADLNLVPAFAAGEPTAGTLTVASSAQKQALWVVEVHAEDLDTSNDFTWFRATVPDVGSISQLGGMMAIVLDDSDGPEDFRYAQEVLTDAGMITPTAAIPGLYWNCNSDSGLPQTIYGISLVSVTGNILYAYHRLLNPITIQQQGQLVVLRPPPVFISDSVFQ